MEKKSSLIAQLYIFFKKIWLKKRKFQYTKFNIYFINFFLKNKYSYPLIKISQTDLTFVKIYYIE